MDTSNHVGISRLLLTGDVDWNVAFHPYPENLFEPRTWLDQSATASDDTPRITFKNIELLPRFLAQRDRADAPLAATLLTAGVAIIFLLLGDPIWLVAAANFTYLIGIGMPSIAVWLLRRDAPEMPRGKRLTALRLLLALFRAARQKEKTT